MNFHESLLTKIREQHPDMPEEYIYDCNRILNVTGYLNLNDLRLFMLFGQLHDAFEATIGEALGKNEKLW